MMGRAAAIAEYEKARAEETAALAAAVAATTTVFYDVDGAAS